MLVHKWIKRICVCARTHTYTHSSDSVVNKNKTELWGCCFRCHGQEKPGSWAENWAGELCGSPEKDSLIQKDCQGYRWRGRGVWASSGCRGIAKEPVQQELSEWGEKVSWSPVTEGLFSRERGLDFGPSVLGSHWGVLSRKWHHLVYILKTHSVIWLENRLRWVRRTRVKIEQYVESRPEMLLP